jgi:hypothetical protein
MIGSTLWDFQKGFDVYEDSIEVLLPEAVVKILMLPKRDYTKKIEETALKEYIFKCIQTAKQGRFGRRYAEVYDIFISTEKSAFKYWVSYDIGNRKLSFWPSKINDDGSNQSGNSYLSNCTLDEFNEKLKGIKGSPIRQTVSIARASSCRLCNYFNR